MLHSLGLVEGIAELADVTRDKTGLQLDEERLPHFEISKNDALKIGREVGAAVSGWRRAAKQAGLSPPAVKRMASAFDHEDLRAIKF